MTTAERTDLRIGRLHRPAFYTISLVTVGLFIVLMRDLLPLAISAWVVDTGVHRFHDLNFFILMWVVISGIVVQGHSPERRVTAAAVPVLVMVPLAVMALSVQSPIAMMPVLFSVLSLGVVVLHPAGRSLLSIRRVESMDRSSAVLLGLAAIPLLAYAINQLTMQYRIPDEHAALVHYGGMALTAVLILVLGTLAVLRDRDWRFAAWSAALLAWYLGASSILFPGMASSAEPLWGAGAIAWGLGFVFTVETSRSDRTQLVTASIDIEAPIDVVWAITTDPQSFVEAINWVHEAWMDGDGPLTEGSVYIERASPGLVEGTYRWEVTTAEPPKRAVHVHAGRELEAELEVTLDELGPDRTRYSQVMHFRALPVFRPLGFILERTVMKRQMQRDFEEMILPNYKRMAEEQYRAVDE